MAYKAVFKLSDGVMLTKRHLLALDFLQKTYSDVEVYNSGCYYTPKNKSKKETLVKDAISKDGKGFFDNKLNLYEISIFVDLINEPDIHDKDKLPYIDLSKVDTTTHDKLEEFKDNALNYFTLYVKAFVSEETSKKLRREDLKLIVYDSMKKASEINNYSIGALKTSMTIKLGKIKELILLIKYGFKIK